MMFAATWWRRVDSNHRSETQQIYSLPPLATRELLHMKFWSWWTDSNPRPADYKSAALPTELHQHVGRNWRVLPNSKGYYSREFSPCQSFFKNFLAPPGCPENAWRGPYHRASQTGRRNDSRICRAPGSTRLCGTASWKLPSGFVPCAGQSNTARTWAAPGEGVASARSATPV